MFKTPELNLKRFPSLADLLKGLEFSLLEFAKKKKKKRKPRKNKKPDKGYGKGENGNRSRGRRGGR
jgi:hypothetical protein